MLEETLPSAWYLEEGIYALEREHIFAREWLCVGREEELPECGDHLFGDRLRGLAVARIPGGLPAAGLRLGHLDDTAGVLQKLDGGESDRRAEHVHQAGDKQRNARLGHGAPQSMIDVEV